MKDPFLFCKERWGGRHVGKEKKEQRERGEGEGGEGTGTDKRR